MRVCVIGPGYVGLVTAACLAETGNDVVCIGKPGVDDRRIERLSRGECPIYEKGLEELIRRNLASGRLHFGLDLQTGVRDHLFQIIAVPTPSDEDGGADLQHVLAVARDIGRYMEEYRLIVIKSTVPVGTADAVQHAVARELEIRGKTIDFDVVSNPEFLKEGDAVNDFLKPDRVIVGCSNPKTAQLMKNLFAPFARSREKMILMDVRSAEMTKYAANAMLATKISFMNEIARLCERVQADISLVRKGIGSDPRIGYPFTYAGVGFGGSCFPKDLRALISTSRAHGVRPHMLEAVLETNEIQKRLLFDKVADYFRERGGLHGRCVAVWGLAFKPNTNDMREAPSIPIIRALADAGAAIRAFDPAANEEARRVFRDVPHIRFFDDNYRPLEGADCLLLITEWFQFLNPDFSRVKALMKAPVIFDGRNQYDPGEMKRLGFTYISIGRAPVFPEEP